MAKQEILKTGNQQKIFMRGQQEYRHDLFKLEVAEFDKNISWKKKQPQIVKVQHNHFFHSHNDRGQKNQYCSAIGGHFHEIKLIDKGTDSQPEVQCGPPLRKAHKKLSMKMKLVIEPVSFDHEEFGKITDDHRHEMTYLGSEVLSAEKQQAMRDQNQKALGVTEKVEGFTDLDG